MFINFVVLKNFVSCVTFRRKKKRTREGEFIVISEGFGKFWSFRNVF